MRGTKSARWSPGNYYWLYSGLFVLVIRPRESALSRDVNGFTVSF